MMPKIAFTSWPTFYFQDTILTTSEVTLHLTLTCMFCYHIANCLVQSQPIPINLYFLSFRVFWLCLCWLLSFLTLSFGCYVVQVTFFPLIASRKKEGRRQRAWEGRRQRAWEGKIEGILVSFVAKNTASLKMNVSLQRWDLLMPSSSVIVFYWIVCIHQMEWLGIPYCCLLHHTHMFTSLPFSWVSLSS